MAAQSFCPPMSRYFFHIKNDIEVPDPEGQELDNLAAARQLAVAYARDLAAEAVRQGEVDLKHRIVIADEDGDALLTVTFGEAFVIRY